jgi:hypothetical protein
VGSLVGVADSSALALFCSSTNHFRVTVKKEKNGTDVLLGVLC